MQEGREKYSPVIVRMCFRFTIFAKTSANSGQGNQIEYAEYKQGDAEHEQGHAKARARTNQSTSKEIRNSTPTAIGKPHSPKRAESRNPNAARGFEH